MLALGFFTSADYVPRVCLPGLGRRAEDQGQSARGCVAPTLKASRRLQADTLLPSPAECSARHNRGVQELFHEVASCAITVRKPTGGGGWATNGGSGHGNDGRESSCVVA